MSTITLPATLNAARSLDAAWAKWETLDVPKVPHNGLLVKGISKELHHAIMDAVDATADDLDEDGKRDVDPAARLLILILDEIGYAFVGWMQGMSRGLSSCPPRGSEAMNNAFRRLHDALSVPKLPRPQSIESLFAMGAPPAQIAKKYGFKRDDGSPDIEKVFEEHAKPGTHYNPETWVHPAEAVINADVEREWAQREPRPQMFVHHAEQAPAPQRRSIEEMIKALAPVAQIARVYRLSDITYEEDDDLTGSAEE